MTKNIAIIDKANKVINIIIVNDDYILNDNEIEYSDKNSAFIGGDYVEGYFYPQQNYPSWKRDGKGNWLPPTPKPAEGRYFWDEESQSWDNSIT
jgi:hypothetical protein